MSTRWMAVQFVGDTLRLPIVNKPDMDKPFGSSELEREVRRIVVNPFSDNPQTFVPEAEIDKLRELVADMWLQLLNAYDRKEVDEFADRIDAEHQKAIRELNNLADASVLLPVDADGEVIHVGDMMERGEARGHVIALMLSEYPKKWGGGLHWGVQLEGEHAPTALDLTFHHYHAPTVEDVLRDVVTLCHNTWKEGSAFEFYDVDDVMESGNIAEYAAKLRLAEGEDA